jgi:hypothetical protein
MPRRSRRVIPVLLLVTAGACSRHATYGRPAPRDTLPADKEPRTIKQDPPRAWPGEVPTR